MTTEPTDADETPPTSGQLDSAEVQPPQSSDDSMGVEMSAEVAALTRMRDMDASFSRSFGLDVEEAQVAADEPPSVGVALFAALVALGAALLALCHPLVHAPNQARLVLGNLNRGFAPGLLLGVVLCALIVAVNGETNSYGAFDLRYADSFPGFGNADHSTTVEINDLGLVKPNASGISANPDTGASLSAASKPKLFVRSAVKQWAPPLTIRVATGYPLKVTLIGLMMLKGKSTPNTTSTKKYVPFPVEDALLVPGLREGAILISPRASGHPHVLQQPALHGDAQWLQGVLVGNGHGVQSGARRLGRVGHDYRDGEHGPPLVAKRAQAYAMPGLYA